MNQGDFMTQFGSLMMTLLTGLFMLIGLIIILCTRNNNRVVNFSISMAFGVIVMLVLLELIPESYELITNQSGLPMNIIFMIIFTFMGIILLKVLDHFIPDHEMLEENQKEVDDNFLHIGIVSSIALVLHNLIEGMAIYSSTKTSMDMGFLVAIGVGLHNIPMGMVVTSTFYKANKSIHKTVLLTTAIALSTFLGGVIMVFLNRFITDTFLGILLCITLGMLIYIIFFELLEEMIHNKDRKITVIGMLFGIIIFLISMFLE